MTIEKLSHLISKRVAFFNAKLTDEAMTTQLEIYSYNLKDVPDEIADEAFYIAFGKCRYQSQFLVDWTDAIRDMKIEAYHIAPSEQLWADALHTACVMQELWQRGCDGYMDADGTQHKGDGKALIAPIFEAQPLAVQKFFGTAGTQIATLTGSKPSEIARNKYRGFIAAMQAAPVESLRNPQTLPQIDTATSHTQSGEALTV